MLTFAPSVQPFSSSSINGVITSSVSPRRNKQTEYDMNMIGHCHTNTMLRLGQNCVLVLARDCTLVSILTGSMSNGLYLSRVARACDSPAGGTTPSILNIPICCAESRIPRIENTKLLYQQADAAHIEPSTVNQEKDPITAPARTAHYASLSDVHDMNGICLQQSK